MKYRSPPAPNGHPKFRMITGTDSFSGSIVRWLPHETPVWFSSAIRLLGHAEPLPVRGKEETSGLLNHKIAQLARLSASIVQPIVLAEINRDFDSKQNVGKDDPLPNADGATKIAATLSKALQPLLAPFQDQPSK